MRPSISAWLSSVLAFGILSGPAAAQFQQYTPPGDLQGAAENRRTGIEKDVREARWHLGAVRIQPELTLRDLAYVDDVFVGSDEGDVSDLTASLAAGLHFYLPVGTKTTLAAYAVPEYVWWQDQEDRRRLNESYGAAVFAYFNRLTLELSGTSDERLSFATSEIEQQVTDAQDALTAHLEVFIKRNLALFVSASATEFRYLIDEAERNDPRIAPFDRLDRDEELLQAGIRAQIRGGLLIDLGFERSEATFENRDRDLSNSGTAPFLRLVLTRGPWNLNGEVAARSLEAEEGSEFRAFDEPTGRFEVAFKARPRLTLQGAAARNLTYSVADGFTYALDDRYGAGVEVELGRRSSLRIFSETGEIDYTVGASVAPRTDDYTGWGAKFKIALGKKAELQLGLTETDYDSNLPGFDRSVTRITSNLSLSQTSWP